MKTRPHSNSNLSDQARWRDARPWMAACLAFVATLTTADSAVQAGPPSPADSIDYAASGFQLPPGVNPTAWATASGVSSAGGMNFASQPTISGPMMGMPMMGGPAPMGSPASMMAMGMPGMGPNGPIMGRPGMQGPMYQNQSAMQPGGSMPGASSIPTSFPSGPIPGYGPGQSPVVSTGLQAPYGPAAYQSAMQAPYGVMPVGFHQGVGCDGSCGDPACGVEYMECACDGGACPPRRRFRGLLSAFKGDCRQCQGAGCASCAERALQNDCIGYGGALGDMVSGKCMDSDFGILMGSIGGGMAGLAECLSPYTEAGRCAQRWYDVSAEYMGLTSNFSQGGQVFATRGVGGDPVLRLSDVDSSDLASGVRLSLAVIMGVGGNLEVTYMGGHEWSDSARAIGDVNLAGEGNLFSYISAFGITPAGGYDDTDRSLSQSLSAESRFHSGELNYRRRLVGPYCKFQGSWLVGMRYLRFDNDLGYSTVGSFNDGAGITGTLGGDLGNELRFFNSLTQTKNDYFGAQLGCDFWWNVVPGIQFGVEMKGAWMQNDWERNYTIAANSAGPGAVAGTASRRDSDNKGTVMGDLQTTLLYRFSHEWTFRSSYHLMAIDDVLGNTLPRNAIVGAVDGNPLTDPAAAPVVFNSAVLQGFTVGLEYLW
ncbi:BBP7 family outer membrane beta-barrel protein [Neorhodopirellula pilleata]|uniref:Uncharacterized protein n=1 Tax=Neorhodopirellula pilleata TaxID=2714738 RepID=A0A5C6ABC1_9BACT|nr:BBP7 family outer membrane beta-barrel protein [Neorhodopirellula pilleata]TWT96351.1 hypothetical protein Pla100_28280 [Neorhodopirellula pilleata]